MQLAEPAVLDKDEQLLWGVLERLETLGLSKYQHDAPELAIPEKQDVVRTLHEHIGDSNPVDASSLGPPVRDLLDAASKSGQADTLIVQGLLLERLGQIIYKVLRDHNDVSPATRSLAAKGLYACTTVIDLATQQVRTVIGEGDSLFDVFSNVSESTMRRLDALGSCVDELFGKRFGLTFTEVLGDFTAELLPACVELGMNRRKLICHLTSVFMGQ